MCNFFCITKEEIEFMKELTKEITTGQTIKDTRPMEAKLMEFAKHQAANLNPNDLETSAGLLMLRSHIIAILGTLPADHPAFKMYGVGK